MSIVAQLAWTGFATASFYCLSAIAFALVLKVNQVWNFAQAGVMVIAYYAMYVGTRVMGMPLVGGLLGNFAFGALMTIGIGSYGPSLILFGLLGLDLKAIFPVMMGSCACLMPAGSVPFLREGRLEPRAALGLTLGGLPGVLCAALLVREMPIVWLRWLVIGVVTLTATGMLRAAYLDRDSSTQRL